MLNKPLRQSTLKKILLSTGKFWSSYNSDESKDTPDTLIGRSVHLLILQPHLKNLIVIKPDLDSGSRISKIVKMIHGSNIELRITENKTKKQEEGVFYECSQYEYDEAQNFIKNNQEYMNATSEHIILPLKDYDKVMKMVESFFINPDAVQILKSCKYLERNIQWEYRGHQMSSTLDGEGDDFVLDLKTTSHNNMKDFKNDFIYVKENSGGYAYQAASYLKASGRPDKRFLAIYIEKTEPYDVWVFEVSKDIIEIGESQFEESFDKLDQCLSNKSFKTYNKIQYLQ